MFIKLCGITNLDDALDAVELGIDALGFNFYKDSEHYIHPDAATRMIEDIPPTIKKVGVFVNEQEQVVKDLCQILALDFIEFQGDETPYYCEQFATPYWKEFHLKDEHTLKLMDKYKPESFVVDPGLEKIWGGKGMTAHWDLIGSAKEKGPLILAGSLDAQSIEMAVSAIKPFGVNICEGAEDLPGQKSRMKLEELITMIRQCELQQHSQS
jgi:phosphoribosylanthranilate isomerase